MTDLVENTDLAQSSALADAFEAILAAHCTPTVVRAVEAGDLAKTQALMQAMEASGFVDALLPESKGGAGLSLMAAYPLFKLCGRFAMPLPLAQTMLQRASGAAPDRVTHACLLAAQMAGAMQRVLAMSLQYANDRQQFGKPLGKFQAIQHQLAVMAEQVFAADMAAQIGCSPAAQSVGYAWQPDPLRAAIAKARASEAAVEVSALAHSIHGAIGFTEAFDLQIFTRRLHTWRQAAGSESYWHKFLGEAMMRSPDSTLDLLRTCTDVD